MREITEKGSASISSSGAPTVSIITPAYNAADFISETIASVLAQTYPHWELLLIIDRKTTDATAEISQDAAQKDARIKVIQTPDCSSLAANRNKGLDIAKGQYIAFLDSDDKWLPEKLEHQVRFMQNQKANISFHSYSVIDENGKPFGPIRYARNMVGYYDLLRNNTIGCLTVMIRRSFIKDHRMKEIRHEDLEFWLRLLGKNNLAQPIPEILAEYRVRQNSVSYNKFKSVTWRWQLYRNLEVPPLRVLYYLLTYLISGILKRL